MTRDHERLSTTTLLTLCLAAFCSVAALAVPVFAELPHRVAEAAGIGDLRWVLAAGVAAAVVLAPVLGWLSDLRVPRLGHRVPWTVGAVVAGAGMLSVAAAVDNLAALTLAWAAAVACFVAALTTLLATLADVAPAPDRCRAAGWFTAATAGALLLGAGAYAWSPGPTVTFTAMGFVAVGAAVAAGRRLLRVPMIERPAPGIAPEPAGPPFWWLWLQRLVAQAAFSFIGVLGVSFVTRRTGRLDDAEAIATTGYVAATALGLLLAGLVARRLARRAGFSPVLSLGLALVMLGNAVAAIATSSPAFLLAVIVAGAGFWMYAALDLAAVLALLPGSTRGQYLGLFAGAQLLAPAAAVVAAPWLWSIGDGDLVGADQARNYFVLFAIGGGLALASVLVLGRVPLPDADGVRRHQRPRQNAATP